MLTSMILSEGERDFGAELLSILQEQIKQLLLCPFLSNRLLLVGSSEQWLELRVIIPLEKPSATVTPPLAQITVSIHFTNLYPREVPAMYLSSDLLPLSCQFFNLLTVGETEYCTLSGVLTRFVREIDEVGFRKWSEIAYQFCMNECEIKEIEKKNEIINENSSENNPSPLQNVNIDCLTRNIIIENKDEKNHKKSSKLDQTKDDEISGEGFNQEKISNEDSESFLEVKEKDKTNAGDFLIARQTGQEFGDDGGSQKGNSILSSPFSCFKPIQQIKIGLEKPQLEGNSCKPIKNKEKEKSHEKSKNNFPDNLSENIENTQNEHRRPKPMNKNANLPKFLIRIFIKYVDRYKANYVKREYDRLVSECKKMKEWKKNDRRQHAFGLKHLKLFFQDFVEGFPDPSLNRKTISKIIDNYLLSEICQNSQIPESHRVGYLIACRVYSIRCRNASLASRIQSK